MTELSLVAMRCGATSEPDTAAGMQALAAALARRVGAPARFVGSERAQAASTVAEELHRLRGCLLEAGGQVQDALHDGRRPVLVGGDGSIAIGTLPAIAAARPDARVLWLDAHACFALPPGEAGAGRLEQTALAGACGCWDTGHGGGVDPGHLVLCATRSMSDDERALLARLGVRVIGTTLETLVHLQHALEGRPTYVHVDVDVLDEVAAAVAHPVDGGLPAEKLLDLLDAVADSCEVVGIQVCGLAGASDAARRAPAELVADALEPLLA